MQLGWGPDEVAFRDDLVAFLDAHAPAEALAGNDMMEHGSSDAGSEIVPEWSREWQATLFDHGWMIPGYPPEHGGRNATPVQTLIYLEEMARRRIPRSLHFPGYAIVAPSLLEFGNDEQRALVPAAIRGDTIWCIGMSEPNAGSDLAGLQTRAVLDGDRFVVNGQKVWTSYATVSQKCMVYVRTDPDVPKHKGISLLIVDMDTPGIEVRPLRHLTGAAHFAEVFFTDVEVPVENLVGELNGGWRITQGSLAHERAGLWVEGVSRLESTVDLLVDLARRRGLGEDAGIRRRIATMYEQAASLRALGYKGFASFAQGSSAPEHSYMKMATSELGKATYELGMELQGAYGVVRDSERGEEQGRWVDMFFLSFANTVAGGSSEIQRNIIAQRVLGLPRS
ncbi:MAG TPA: acyl-CoA dehydrogenase family protein [Acidimicrobiia bacterium]|nr:acyl-CoA dehydrogenase family protein [Acidimicrobiia bacterium]